MEVAIAQREDLISQIETLSRELEIPFTVKADDELGELETALEKLRSLQQERESKKKLETLVILCWNLIEALAVRWRLESKGLAQELITDQLPAYREAILRILLTRVNFEDGYRALYTMAIFDGVERLLKKNSSLEPTASHPLKLILQRIIELVDDGKIDASSAPRHVFSTGATVSA